jgi:hypothetical protein
MRRASAVMLLQCLPALRAPDNARVRVLASSVAREHGEATPAQTLYGALQRNMP